MVPCDGLECHQEFILTFLSDQDKMVIEDKLVL